jgi:K(+)-stimulated pyrophosphate-energized sodium pump
VLGVAGTMGLLAGATVSGFAVAIFMANAGGAWDNCKKYIEAGNYGGKGGFAHKAGVVGDTVGDPFKDTSSVAMNPVIKFTTLFGLLAVELGVYLAAERGTGLSHTLAVIAFALSMYFVYRSFYGMRIESESAVRV